MNTTSNLERTCCAIEAHGNPIFLQLKKSSWTLQSRPHPLPPQVIDHNNLIASICWGTNTCLRNQHYVEMQFHSWLLMVNVLFWVNPVLSALSRLTSFPLSQRCIPSWCLCSTWAGRYSIGRFSTAMSELLTHLWAQSLPPTRLRPPSSESPCQILPSQWPLSQPCRPSPLCCPSWRGVWCWYLRKLGCMQSATVKDASFGRGRTLPA